ncbi:MAG TPA: COX15/CtaA family protein [Labilithrix sp.]|jgi:cytochrome c oxidase assembly protein subunit 15/protoheme IX farnesyltransferase
MSIRFTTRRFATFAWAVLAYNLLVIAWGAFVRASGSGAGCGRHWPLCNGEVVPRAPRIETIIEATHRATSGVALVLVVALAAWAWFALPHRHLARRTAIASLVFMFGEALLGAGLVLFELVAHDASMKRALSMILHLGNTFLLLASLTATAWFATVGDRAPSREPRARLVRSIGAALLASVLVLASSGAIAALGDTLFPSRSLAEGFAQDLSPMAHGFVRLRMLHPFLAVATAVVVIGATGFLRILRPNVKPIARAVVALVVAQIGAGLLNLWLLAPIPMQLVHLLLADAVWIALVLLVIESALQSPAMSRNGPAPTSDVPPSTSNVAPVT